MELGEENLDNQLEEFDSRPIFQLDFSDFSVFPILVGSALALGTMLGAGVGLALGDMVGALVGAMGLPLFDDLRPRPWL